MTETGGGGVVAASMEDREQGGTEVVGQREGI